VIDGAKALRKAIRSVFGEVPVQRCVRHKERNVLDHLPERDRPAVKQRLRRAWAESDQARALDQLRRLALELERTHPGAAGSLREGLEETLTLTRLGIAGSLKRTLESTNPCESISALCPPVTKILRPLSSHVSPSFTARVRMAAVSDPACGSVIAIADQVGFSPAKRARNFSFCSGVPVASIAAPPSALPGVHR